MSDAADVVEALVAGFTAAVPDGVTVIDGPPWDPPTADFLCVGHTGGEDQPGVVAATPTFTMAGAQSEALEISNYLIVFIDDQASVTAARRRAVDIYRACQSWVLSDLSLGGLVSGARIDGYSLTVVQLEESGTAVALAFSVADTSF